jgi:F0F1-type ATP synthase gamma subunit
MPHDERAEKNSPRRDYDYEPSEHEVTTTSLRRNTEVIILFSFFSRTHALRLPGAGARHAGVRAHALALFAQL